MKRRCYTSLRQGCTAVSFGFGGRPAPSSLAGGTLVAAPTLWQLGSDTPPRVLLLQALVVVQVAAAEHDDLLSGVLPPLVLLEADVAVVLSWVESPRDSSAQVSEGPVEVMVQ